jgi:hypothetical protein
LESTPLDVRLAVPGRELPARLQYVYRGAVADPSKKDREPQYGTQSQHVVRRQLVLANPGIGDSGTMPPGRALIVFGEGGQNPVARERLYSFLREAVAEGEDARFDLGPAAGLKGERLQLGVERSPDGAQVTERYEFKVENRTTELISLRIEEPLARSGRATLVRSTPTAVRDGRELVFEMDVAPGEIATAHVEVSYSW